MEVEININTPIRQHLSPGELWRQDDKGIIKAWELGRLWADIYPDKSTAAKNGVLLELKKLKKTDLNIKNEIEPKKKKYIRIFKGGFDERQKEPYRYGSLHYYAMWLGLRNDNLNIDLDKEYAIVCSKTKMGVVYTLDTRKYLSTRINSKDLEKYGDDFIEAVSGIS